MGALAVDPLGIVGDGGRAAFETELLARTPRDARERAADIDARAMSAQASAEEEQEALRALWPAYFADPERAPEMPAVRMSIAAYAGLMEEVSEGVEEAARALASGNVRYGVLAGAGSPIPWGQAARASAELSPSAFLTVVPGAGHFPWIEAPGCLRDAIGRLHD